VRVQVVEQIFESRVHRLESEDEADGKRQRRRPGRPDAEACRERRRDERKPCLGPEAFFAPMHKPDSARGAAEADQESPVLGGARLSHPVQQ
jgi:hypothetical protein